MLIILFDPWVFVRIANSGDKDTARPMQVFLALNRDTKKNSKKKDNAMLDCETVSWDSEYSVGDGQHT